MSKLKSIIIVTFTGALLTIGFACAMSESGLKTNTDEPITNEQSKIAVKQNELKEKEAPVKTDNVKENLNENASNYRANRIYIGGSSMPMKATNMASLQKFIDDTTHTWISIGSYNPSDNQGTYFGLHNQKGGSVIYGMQKGHSFIVTDSSGNPHTYVVEKVYVQNKQKHFDDELIGDLNKEYVVLQTSEPGVNGNRHVIAVKNN